MKIFQLFLVCIIILGATGCTAPSKKAVARSLSGAEKKDTDNDGYLDEEELAWGTNPYDATEFPTTSETSALNEDPFNDDLSTDLNDYVYAGNDYDDPGLPNFDGSGGKGDTNWMSTLGKAGAGAAGMLSSLNITSDTDICVSPVGVGMPVSPAIQTELIGEPFTSIADKGMMSFKGGLFTRTGGAEGFLTNGKYSVAGGILTLVPIPYMGCIEMYAIIAQRFCVAGFKTCGLPDGFPKRVQSYVLKGLRVKDKKPIVLDYLRYIPSVCTIAGSDCLGASAGVY